MRLPANACGPEGKLFVKETDYFTMAWRNMPTSLEILSVLPWMFIILLVLLRIVVAAV
jgi:hypothetical protein